MSRTKPYRFGGVPVLKRTLLNPYCTEELVHAFLFGGRCHEPQNAFQEESVSDSLADRILETSSLKFCPPVFPLDNEWAVPRTESLSLETESQDSFTDEIQLDIAADVPVGGSDLTSEISKVEEMDTEEMEESIGASLIDDSLLSMAQVSLPEAEPVFEPLEVQSELPREVLFELPLEVLSEPLKDEAASDILDLCEAIVVEIIEEAMDPVESPPDASLASLASLVLLDVYESIFDPVTLVEVVLYHAYSTAILNSNEKIQARLQAAVETAVGEE